MTGPDSIHAEGRSGRPWAVCDFIFCNSFLKELMMTLTTRQENRSLAQRGALFLLTLGAGMTLCVAVNAANMGKKSEIESNYQRERASCMNGTSNEDRATCLKEAGAAREEARRGALNDDGAAEQQNAVSRCNMLPQNDRVDCVRRIQGDGTVSGSAAAGGIFRETVTTVPAAPDAAPAANPR
jgi:hypothetical protein